MAVYYRTQGIVFKKKDISETDRIFSVFTSEFGRVEVFGKAIRKITSKLRGGIDIFNLSEIEFIQGKNRKTLTDTIAIEKFSNIIQEPVKLKISYEISNILDSFIKGQEKDEFIFFLIKETFNKLNNPDLQIQGAQVVYCYFIWNFLSVAGYLPEIKKCTICKSKLNPDVLYFSNKNGGVICHSCLNLDAGAKKINSDIVKILRLIINKDWQIISKLKIDNFSKNLLKEISDNYCQYIFSSYSFDSVGKKPFNDSFNATINNGVNI